jgi:NAD(P) transhydrogenase subunit alpha
VAVTAATINVVGGFMITDRMLKMFKRQEPK